MHLNWTGLLTFIALALTPLSASAGRDDFAPEMLGNRQRIATAMADQLLPPETGRIANFADLNLDGYWELVARRPNCSTCASVILKLNGEEFVGLIDQADGGPVVALPTRTNGFPDLRAGARTFSFDGARYRAAGVTSSPLPDTDTFDQLCAASGMRDDFFDRAGIEREPGRAQLCSCIVARLSLENSNQEAVDAAGRAVTLAAVGQGGPALVTKLPTDLEAMTQSCLVQDGWRTTEPIGPQMYATYTEDYSVLMLNPNFPPNLEILDENVLDYSQFVPTCSTSETAISSANIGSRGRAVSVCGCIAERLSMVQIDQAQLNAVAGLYDGSVSEEEAEAHTEGLVAFSDDQAKWCVNRMRLIVDEDPVEAGQAH